MKAKPIDGAAQFRKIREAVAKVQPSAPSPVYPPVTVAPPKVRIVKSQPTEPQRTTYAEKLRDPRWQKRRLEVMERDRFTCQRCRATDKTLHVHHLSYERGKDPWDYCELSLLTLCQDCHALAEDPRLLSDVGLLRVLPISRTTVGNIVWFLRLAAEQDNADYTHVPKTGVDALHQCQSILLSVLARCHTTLSDIEGAE